MANDSQKQEFIQAALDYHQFPKPGKIAIEITTPTDSQRDLALAYSPGVAGQSKKSKKIQRMPINIQSKVIWLE